MSKNEMVELRREYDRLVGLRTKKDFAGATKGIGKMKLTLISGSSTIFLPTEHEEMADHKPELLLWRDLLELSVYLAVDQKDMNDFERAMAQLKTYYTDCDSILMESGRKYECLGLNLMYLLAKNRMAEFHIELEQLPFEKLENDAYIRTVVRLEQFLMEGSYNKVVLMRSNIPSDSYEFFMDQLLIMIKDEIASCMEKAYSAMLLTDFMKLIQLKDTTEAKKYVNQRGWKLKQGSGKAKILFQATDQKHVEEVPTDELARMAITYAREMEQII